MSALEPGDNLDDTWPDELMGFAARYVGDHRPGVKLLVGYAYAKAKAMNARAKGDIAVALDLENECDGIYRMLPACYRW